MKNTRIGSYFFQSFNYILSSVNSSKSIPENKNSSEKIKQQDERKSNVLADSGHSSEKRKHQEAKKSNDLVIVSVDQDENIVEDISQEQDATSKHKFGSSGQK